MLEAKDWMTGIVGVIVFCLGLFPLLASMGSGPAWFGIEIPITVSSWILAIGAIYLFVDSFVEIANSNIVGWISFFVAVVFAGIGILAVLGSMKIVSGFIAMGWLTVTVYYLMFLVLGFFLTIATFARKL